MTITQAEKRVAQAKGYEEYTLAYEGLRDLLLYWDDAEMRLSEHFGVPVTLTGK